MKFASIREFRTHIHDYANESEAIIVTRHGKPVLYTFPMGGETEMTLEAKREAFKKLAEERKRYFGHIDEKEMLKDFAKWRKERRSRRRGGR